MSEATRIGKRFAQLKKEGRGGLVVFITAGDPDPETSQALLDGLPEAGADIIELGMPFSDPMADGPSIQRSSLRALRSGQTLKKTLAMVRRFRQRERETPVILMGYYNPIYVYGNERFLNDAKEAGVDGLIIVDLPPEENRELCLPSLEAGIDFIFLTAPTSDDARLPKILEHARGFVYYVSITGITGTRTAAIGDVKEAVERLRRHTDLPIAVGFGIKTPEQAAAVAGVAEAAVVGSAVVDKIAEHLDENGKPRAGLAQAVLGLARDLAAGVRGGTAG